MCYYCKMLVMVVLVMVLHSEPVKLGLDIDVDEALPFIEGAHVAGRCFRAQSSDDVTTLHCAGNEQALLRLLLRSGSLGLDQFLKKY